MPRRSHDPLRDFLLSVFACRPLVDRVVKIWKVVNDEICGYGNGHRTVIYTTPGNEYDIKPITTCLVYKGNKRVAKTITTNEAAAKRWAEKNYLKGDK